MMFSKWTPSASQVMWHRNRAFCVLVAFIALASSSNVSRCLAQETEIDANAESLRQAVLISASGKPYGVGQVELPLSLAVENGWHSDQSVEVDSSDCKIWLTAYSQVTKPEPDHSLDSEGVRQYNDHLRVLFLYDGQSPSSVQIRISGRAGLTVRSAAVSVSHSELMQRWRDTLHNQPSAIVRLISQTDSLLKSSQDQLYALSLSTAVNDWENGSVAEARYRLAESPNASRGWEYHALAKLMNESSTVLATNTPALSLAISPDGKRIASGGLLVINSRDSVNNIRMHNAESGELIFSIAGHAHNVNGVRFHPEGKLFATCSDDRLIKVWDGDTGSLVATLAGHSLGVTSIDFSKDGSQLVSCGRDGDLKLWDLSSQECTASWKFRPDQNTPVVSVKFSPSGKMIASGRLDGTVCVWDAATHNAKLEYKQHQSSVTGLSFLDETRLVSVSDDGSTRQWNLDRNQLDAAFEQHIGGAYGVASVPTRNLFATCGADNRIYLWNSDDRELERKLLGHENPVVAIVASPDGRRLFSSSTDATIRRWDLSRTHQPMVTMAPQSSFTSNLALTPDGSQMVRGLANGQIGFWQIESGELARISEPNSWRINALAIDAVGQTLACIKSGKSVDVLNANDFSIRRSMKKLPSYGGCLAFAPNRPWLAIGTNKDIIVWNYETDEQVIEWQAHEFTVGNLQFSADGKRLYSSSISGGYGVKIWEADTWREIDHLGRSLTSKILELDSTGDLLMTSGASKFALILWDTHRLQHRLTIPTQRKSIRSATFNVAANRVAIIGGRDTSDSIQLWNLSSGQEIVRLKQFGLENAHGMTFNSDGTKLVVTAEDSIYVWDGRISELKPNTVIPAAQSVPAIQISSIDQSQNAIATTHDSRFAGHLWDIKEIAFNSDGTKIVSGGMDQTVKVWNALTGRMLLSFDVRDQVTDVKYSRDDSMVATALEDGKIKLFKMDDLKSSLTLRGHQGPVLSVDFRPDENQLASIGSDGSARIWDINSGEQLSIIQDSGPSRKIAANLLAFNPSGNEIALFLDRSRAIRIFDVLLNTQQEILTGHRSETSCLAFNSDGTLLASAGFDGTVRIWNAKTKSDYATIKAHGKPIQCICFGAEGNLYTSSLAEGLVKIWEIKNQRELRAIPFKDVACFSVYSQGNLLAAAGGKEIRIFKLDE